MRIPQPPGPESSEAPAHLLSATLSGVVQKVSPLLGSLERRCRAAPAPVCACLSPPPAASCILALCGLLQALQPFDKLPLLVDLEFHGDGPQIDV